MDRRAFLGMTMTLCLGAFPATAFAQAAAESALIHAGSATSTVKAGSVLNHALNQSSKQLAGHIQERTSSSLQSEARQNQQQLKLKSQARAGTVRAGTVRTDSVPGNIITSIQGGEVTCAPTELKTQAPGDKTNTESKNKNCRSKDPSLKPGPQGKD